MDDRGGKMYITDCALSSFNSYLQWLFSCSQIKIFKSTILLNDYSMIKSNASFQSNFQILMDSISSKLPSEVSGFESSSTNSSHCNPLVVEAMDCTYSSTFEVFESSGLQTPWQKDNGNEFESCVDN